MTTDLAASGEQHRGQLRMAYRLATRWGDRLRHAHGLGWYIWDGARWAPDRDGGTTRAVVDTIKAAYRELPDLARVERDALYSDIRKAESASGVAGVLTLTAALKPIAVTPDRLDSDPYLFNMPNGTLDLRIGDVRPHSPDDLITRVAGAELDLSASGTAWGRFVSEVLPDEDVRFFAQRVFGLAMLGEVREHVLPIFTGTGLNGKGTMLDAMRAAFGDYAISAEPDLLIDQGRSSHPTGQADLFGSRLAVCSETDDGRRFAAATMKRLTGGDTIRARKMRGNFFEFAPSHTLILMTNHRPKVSADDPAVWRRLRIVPFDVVVDRPDPGLPRRLQSELPALLAWAYGGWEAYQGRGLDAPAAVMARTEQYRASNDALGRFLEEQTFTGPFHHVRARQLYEAWHQWCYEVGEQSGTEKDFAERLATRGFAKKRSAGGMTYQGLGLAAEAGEVAS